MTNKPTIHGRHQQKRMNDQKRRPDPRTLQPPQSRTQQDTTRSANYDPHEDWQNVIRSPTDKFDEGVS